MKYFNNTKYIAVLSYIILAFSVGSVFAQTGTGKEAAPTPSPAPKEAELPKPDIADGKYGEFAANTFDLWKAQSKTPTPLVVYIHGGGLASAGTDTMVRIRSRAPTGTRRRWKAVSIRYDDQEQVGTRTG